LALTVFLGPSKLVASSISSWISMLPIGSVISLPSGIFPPSGIADTGKLSARQIYGFALFNIAGVAA
jgi:hypothetical protein